MSRAYNRWHIANERTLCQVPYCKRTRHGDPRLQQWICAEHWRQTDRRTRLLFFRVNRKARRFGWTASLERLHGRLWVKLRDQAIEAAAGLG